MDHTPPVVTQLCGAREAACICELAPGHNGPHVCSCKGSWGIVNGEWTCSTMPHGKPPTRQGAREALEAAMDAWPS